VLKKFGGNIDLSDGSEIYRKIDEQILKLEPMTEFVVEPE
jgi:hypothetical protein